MKATKGIELTKVCGDYMLVGVGEDAVDFTYVIKLNETSLFIWNKIVEGVDTVDGLVKALMDEYEVDEATARHDTEELLKQFSETKAITE